MKIAYFTDTYKPQINGVITSIDSFVDELRNNGHEVTLVVPKVPNYKQKDKDTIPVASLKFRLYPAYRIALPISLKKKDFADFDIIHVHTPAFVGLAGMRIAHKDKIPLVMTFHTKFADYAHYVSKGALMEKLMKKGINTYTKSFFNEADAIVAPTEEIKKELETQKIKPPIYVIPTGIDIEPIKTSKHELRKKYGFGDEKIILHVGRVTKEKNIIIIIEAFRLLKRLLRNDAKLIIASDGPYREKLEDYAAKNKIKNIMFTGYLSAQSLKEYYRLADVFVMASETETQGLVILEALSQSLPVVVTNAPVISDFVRENGVGIISDKDSSSLAKAIEKSLSSKKSFEKQRKKVLEKYSSKSCTARMIELYEDLVQ